MTALVVWWAWSSACVLIAWHAQRPGYARSLAHALGRAIDSAIRRGRA